MSSVRGEENDELLSAKDSIALARKTSKAAAPSAWQSFFEVHMLCFYMIGLICQARLPGAQAFLPAQAAASRRG